MEFLSTKRLNVLLSRTFPAILLLLLSSFAIHVSAATLGNETDKLALLEFKAQIIDDPLEVLASWNNSIHFCQWIGVTCGLKHQRVTGLDLDGQKLSGTISPHIGNLSFLQLLDLANNSFHGEIPPESGRLTRLKYLNMSTNFLEGEIPVNLSRCSKLLILRLSSNQLKRQIPVELGSFPNLVVLSLFTNNLTGMIPASIGNLSSLQRLSVGYNFLEGEVPYAFSQMKKLTAFLVGSNNISGVFPPFLYNLSSLELISLTSNQFKGSLMPDIGLSLPHLKVLDIGKNQFTGPIPLSLSNVSYLKSIDLPDNRFTGNVPLSFGKLQSLQWLGIGNNLLGNYGADDLIFLTSLANCSQLNWLDIGYNHYGGELPNSVSNLSTQITWLTMGGNRIGGTIPAGLENLVGLLNLCMQSNLLTGNIPASIGKLPKLTGLSLNLNQLTGQIPSSFGNLTQMLNLDLSYNSLEGHIPRNLPNCQNIQYLDLSHNQLSGTIPNQLIGLPSLSVIFNLSHNSFNGYLPPDVGNLKVLVALDVSNNKLSGEIPSTLSSCMALEKLFLQGNFFQGTIPYLPELKGIQFMDLSGNNLSGQIPEYLASFSTLLNLNLSFNNLAGPVPVKGVFQNASAVEVYGNSKLCGGVNELKLQPCPVQKSEKHRNHHSLKLILVTVGVTISFSLILASISLCWIRKSKKPLSTPSFGHFYPKVSYEDLLRATERFSSGQLIGMGNFGTVYKGTLGPNETTVAVKVLNLKERGASKSFIAECQALKNIRHRNLVKVLTACSSVDFQGNEFKALVYEFMQNGSLETWLHPEDEWKQLRNLSLLQRINIAIDVASALTYLHHHCRIPVIHCDLKPSNVLLDNNLTAHVSDFGLARLVSASRKDIISSIGINGTIGYIAPEYALGGRVSTQGDVYSYGILLLEMFTGKRPTDELLKDELNLPKLVKMALPEKVIDIVESNIGSLSSHTSEQINCLISVLVVGVKCSEESPRCRINMREVLKELISVRDKFLGVEQLWEALCSPVNR